MAIRSEKCNEERGSKACEECDDWIAVTILHKYMPPKVVHECRWDSLKALRVRQNEKNRDN